MPPPHPEKKLFFVAPLQDEEALSRNVNGPFKKNNVSGDKEPELEIEPSEVTEIIPQCCEFDNQVNLLSEAYHLVYGGPKNLLHSSNLTKIETPMKNTVLHIAAWYGNNDIVNLVIERAPKLLFSFNKNNDSALHVAARGGHISTVEKLLASYANIERSDDIKKAWLAYTNKLDDPNYDESSNTEDLLQFVKIENSQGNTMFHEAMLCDKSIFSRDMIFKVCELYKTEDRFGNSLSECCYEIALDTVNLAKKSVLYLAVENGDKDAVELILKKFPQDDVKLEGLSPVVAAIMKQNQEMLNTILENKKTWIHSRDKHERLPLHYASSIGYLEGVDLLLGKCQCCTIQRDKYGYFPIHLASYGGHVEVVKKLLEHCPDPAEMLDTSHERNILHIASNYGKYEVVQYILQSQIREHHKMINQRDNKGDTPLHLAARSCHPTTVYYLVNQSKERVKLDLLNQNNETALDIVSSLYELDKSSLRQHLTWTALKSVGAKQSSRRVAHHIESKESDSKSPKTELPNEDQKLDHVGSKLSASDSPKTESDKDKKLDHVGSKLSNLDSPKTESDKDQKLDHVGSKLSDSYSPETESDKDQKLDHVRSKLSASDSPETESDKDQKEDNVEASQSQQSETKHSNEKSTKTEEKQSNKEKEKVSERYKDRIENLTIVSTLIITASVAACLAVPGEAEGKAHNLCHAMFHAFIIFITISLFSSISATIILFWATLGLTELVTFTLKIVMPLLGIALISLSLAFMAGLYTVISELTWLANVFLVMAVIFVAIVILLYMLLFLPSSSTSKPLRYISHYPYLFLASRTESKPDQGVNPWS